MSERRKPSYLFQRVFGIHKGSALHILLAGEVIVLEPKPSGSERVGFNRGVSEPPTQSLPGLTRAASPEPRHRTGEVLNSGGGPILSLAFHLSPGPGGEASTTNDLKHSYPPVHLNL